MTSRDKGNRVRRKCIERLKLGNFKVDVVEKTGRFQPIKDLYGLFDLIAIDEFHTYLIQVTCNRPHNHHAYIGFAKQYKTEFRHIEQWVWIDRKGWTIFMYDKDGNKLRKIYK